MRTKIYLVTLLIAFVTIFGLTACMNEDEPKDITKEVTLISASKLDSRVTNEYLVNFLFLYDSFVA